MLGIIFWLAVGIFIGWNVERPEWSRELQEKIIANIKEVLDLPSDKKDNE